MTAASATSALKNRKAASTTKPTARPKAAKPSAMPAKPVKSQAPPAKKVPAKSVATTAPVVSTPAAAAKPPKEKKVKVVRDSFTLPKSELLQISDMKKRAMALGVEVKKSELIRAGLQALSSMADAPFKKALGNVPTIKTGRPAKS